MRYIFLFTSLIYLYSYGMESMIHIVTNDNFKDSIQKNLLLQSEVIKNDLKTKPEKGISAQDPILIDLPKGQYLLLKLYLKNPFRIADNPQTIPVLKQIAGKLDIQDIRDRITKLHIVTQDNFEDTLQKKLLLSSHVIKRYLNLYPEAGTQYPLKIDLPKGQYLLLKLYLKNPNRIADNIQIIPVLKQIAHELDIPQLANQIAKVHIITNDNYIDTIRKDLLLESEVIKNSLELDPQAGTSGQNPIYIDLTKGQYNLLKLYLLNPQRLTENIQALTILAEIADKLNIEYLLDRALNKLVDVIIQPQNIKQFLENPYFVRNLKLNNIIEALIVQKISKLPKINSYLLAKTAVLLNTIFNDNMYVMTVTPDAKKIVAGSDSTGIKIWDIKTGKLINTFPEYKYSITSLAITPDGSKIISGAADGTIQIWDLVTQKLLKALSEHKEWVTTLAVTPDGSKIISGSRDQTIKVWDFLSDDSLRTINTQHSLNSLAITPDGTKIISGAADGAMQIWDINSGTLLISIEGHEGSVESIIITPDGTQIISGSSDGSIKIWDIRSGLLLITLYRSHTKVNSVAITSDSSKIIAAIGQTIKIWDIKSGLLLNTLRQEEDPYAERNVIIAGDKIISSSHFDTILIRGSKIDLSQLTLSQILLVAARIILNRPIDAQKHFTEIVDLPELQKIVMH